MAIMSRKVSKTARVAATHLLLHWKPGGVMTQVLCHISVPPFGEEYNTIHC